MPHFNLRYFLETLGERKGEDIFILQIGAMDGKTFDPVHEYITRFGWQGLLVEPVKEHFEALKETYKAHQGIVLANVAVVEQDGEVILHRVRKEDVEAARVPKWGNGLASLYRDRNALAFDNVKPYIIEERVQGQRLSTLLDYHRLPRIDVLQIDAEGHDYSILKQFDFTRYQPLVIHVEIVNMPKPEQTACKRLLDANGYIHTKAGYDLLAVAPAFFKAFSGESLTG